MLDFEEELKKFQPSLEVEDIENALRNQKRRQDRGERTWRGRRRFS